ncbi:hypothetical protein CLV92_11683 [Kineococcus xinjiangensis]|uniref:Lipoprotein n=1 Tax=Kineococcus xinjiangensis TaxID=512762 RepID=A0A2S6IDD9_9ACTN|nr:hypothetical protein CLV92_11683 [Kineococcus xinjiangensis]
MRSSSRSAPPLMAVVALVLGACSPHPHDTDDFRWTVNGPLVISHGESATAADAKVAGVVGYDGRCVTVADRPVVWPEGTTWDEKDQAVVLPDGTRAPVGSVIEGGGGYRQPDPAPQGSDEGVVPMLEACAGPTGEVAVLNLASSPTVVPEPPG